MKFQSIPVRTACAGAAFLLAVSTGSMALAAGDHAGGHGHGAHGSHGSHSTATDIGKPAAASVATRTIRVTMHDNYYEPEEITVKAGETVRFIVKNEGTLVHEFNIGTEDMHLAHAPEMQMMVEHGVLLSDRIDMAAAKHMQATMGHGMHDEPNSALLEPGKTAQFAWTFPEDGSITLEFACNVPGHYDAGMVGDLSITAE
ncbi:MAG: copper-binding protein [Alphaproteobacteria bacterium]|nr:copper-binding protein [Alphaproteobacteria bacterium]MAS46417.1 copper-binding protein [Alphaproteobacteria bacterium]MAX94512.1 copper-binding protein [Alphaproteobacteria bacterium]MBN54464.1 copper-binding protein [Alphaproteobacteria bacterium]OUT41985.1 MAG: hypothetical protein CBB62_06670 [Micavibrio sp. TMED2]|tara:strand:- start:22227 stop:22829 length:603 start_codon:yes stop_codon:yes gene_type:complete